MEEKWHKALPVVQVRKLRHREVKSLLKEPIGNECQDQGTYESTHHESGKLLNYSPKTIF